MELKDIQDFGRVACCLLDYQVSGRSKHVCGHGIKNTRPRPTFLRKICSRSHVKTVLIRKAVNIGKIGRSPGDQVSDDIELGLLGEVVLGLMDRGI